MNDQIHICEFHAETLSGSKPLTKTVNINTRSPTIRYASGVKWYIHFLSPKWVESRHP